MVKNDKIKNASILMIVICVSLITLGEHNYIIDMSTQTRFYFSFFQHTPIALGFDIVKKVEMKYCVPAIILCIICFDVFMSIFIKIPMISFIIQIVLIVIYIIYVKSQLNKVA